MRSQTADTRGGGRERAEQLYRLSADAGYAEAQYRLGLFALRRHAQRYLGLAAGQGHADAAVCLARLVWYFGRQG